MPENTLPKIDESNRHILRRQQMLAWAFGAPKLFKFSCDDLGLCLPDLSCCDHELFVDDHRWRWHQFQLRFPHPQIKCRV